MSTQVLIANSGQRLQVDGSGQTQFASVDEFKAWVSRQCRIPVNNVVALTPSGKSVKSVQTLQSEKDVYVYDMRIINATKASPSSSLVSESPMPKRYTPSNPPNSISDPNDLQPWQDLFRARRAWAAQILDECARMADACQARYAEMDVIMRCLDAAVVNLETVVKPIESRYAEMRKWVGPTQDEYAVLATTWDQYLTLAHNVPISSSVVRFMTERDLPKNHHAVLEDLLDLSIAEKLGKRAPTDLKAFNSKVSDLDGDANKMLQGCHDLFREFDNVVNQSTLEHASDATQLLQDIEPLAHKIGADFQTTTEYTNTSRDILQASKMAATHTQSLLPSLRDRALEMDSMLRYAVKSRNTLANGSLEFMRIIAEISALQGSVKSQLNALHQGVEEMNTFDYLRLIQQLPFMYAAFVAESIRRREWTDKMKTDSTTLANEMALFQDEEVKRRRKWQKMVGDTYGPENPETPTKSSVLGLEVNLRGEGNMWPSNVTKDDLHDFLDMLHRADAEPAILADVQKIVTELGAPTRQQTKRLKAFKNGSVHEAALGRSGLLIRGDNDLMQSLQDDKARLEGKLKTAESRVRRLEGLLHQQSQASRTLQGTVFALPSQQLSERHESVTSVKSPRIPDDHRRSVDGDALSQTVHKLEAELAAEKQKAATMETELNTHATKHIDMKDQIAEVNSTKKDLLGNMEALKREFDIERKSMEDDIKQLKARLEDTEDEMEQFGESRENEKVSYDDKVQVLELEIERLKKERKDELLKLQGQVEFLRNESRLQRERNDSLDRRLLSNQDATKGLSKKIETAEEQSATQTKALKNLHAQLTSGVAVAPSAVDDLVEAVSNKATELLGKIQDVERDRSLVKSDLDQEQDTIKQLKVDLSGAKEKHAIEEAASLKAREALSAETAKCVALAAELLTSREATNELHRKISDGETGSGTLRERLEEEEAHVSRLKEEMATKQSQVGSIEEELLLFKEKAVEAQKNLTDVSRRLEARNERTKDLTQRLYSQNDRMCRLLERIGFAVTRKDASITIKKIPRSERVNMQNTGDSSDPNSSIRKSTILNGKPMADSADLELLRWMSTDDCDVEAEKYAAYLEKLGHFDMDLFSDTVYKRMKDVEHIARKLQREVKSYREKAHAYQKEGHDKIAFKHFKEGDLALFLPTRNQTTGAWAAFNVGFPHYFLREQEAHRLTSREWLVARINRVEERQVDLSKSLHQQQSRVETDEDAMNPENDNPFDLSDGLRWYLIDAQEDKAGAPSTPGLAKSTVQATNVEAMAERQVHHHHHHALLGSGKGKDGKGKGGKGMIAGSPSSIEGVSKALTKSLESRRGSTASSTTRKTLPFSLGHAGGGGGGAGAGGGAGSARNSVVAVASETNSLRAMPSDTPVATSPTTGDAVPVLVECGSPAKKKTTAAATGGLDVSSAKKTTTTTTGMEPPPPPSKKAEVQRTVVTEPSNTVDPTSLLIKPTGSDTVDDKAPGRDNHEDYYSDPDGDGDGDAAALAGTAGVGVGWGERLRASGILFGGQAGQRSPERLLQQQQRVPTQPRFDRLVHQQEQGSRRGYGQRQQQQQYPQQRPQYPQHPQQQDYSSPSRHRPSAPNPNTTTTIASPDKKASPTKKASPIKKGPLRREDSTASVESTVSAATTQGKRSVIWDSLWSVDLSYGGNGAGGAGGGGGK